MEHILIRHMLRHFDDKKIISDKQHGFRKGHSCETQLITIVNDLLASADVRNRMDIAILDFSKAFDMVSHRRLMSKLDHYGIIGNIHKWISSFLNNRNQKVVIDGYSSDTIPVDSGCLRDESWVQYCSWSLSMTCPTLVKHNVACLLMTAFCTMKLKL